MDPKYSFQNCQKIVVFKDNNTKVLLAKRKGENDFDGIYSFIGGKMEITDSSIIKGIQREKNEEVGTNFKIKLYPNLNSTISFTKKDGNYMLLPHYYAQFLSGEIELNKNEYSEFKWVSISELDNFEPKIPSIVPIVKQLLQIIPIIKESDFVIL